MASININGEYKESGLTKVEMAKIVQAIFDFVGKQKNINIAFVKSDEIWKLNKEYRKKDAATDVLSFDYGDEGDVLMNLDSISEMKEAGETLSEAAAKTLVHGSLHLLGYDHENNKDRVIMNSIENKIWEKLSE